MTESSRRSDRSWHCRWYSGSLNWCLGSFSFLCRRSARRCSFSASRSACFFSHAAILLARQSQVTADSRQRSDKRSRSSLSYSFSWLTSLRRRPLRSLHASRLVVFSIWAPRARSMEPNPGTDTASDKTAPPLGFVWVCTHLLSLQRAAAPGDRQIHAAEERPGQRLDRLWLHTGLKWTVPMSRQHTVGDTRLHSFDLMANLIYKMNNKINMLSNESQQSAQEVGGHTYKVVKHLQTQWSLIIFRENHWMKKHKNNRS